MFKNVGEKIAAGAIEKLKSQTSSEWHKLECRSGHSFAVELNSDMMIEEHIMVMQSLKCPICSDRSLKTKGVL